MTVTSATGASNSNSSDRVAGKCVIAVAWRSVMSGSAAGVIHSPPARMRTFAAPDHVRAAASNGASALTTSRCEWPKWKSVANRKAIIMARPGVTAS